MNSNGKCKDSTTDKVVDYYTHRYDEQGRHQDAFGVIQELRTMELITRYLPGKELSILDVGGATGVYSFQLADMGHRVTLLDKVPAHIKKARKEDQKRTNRLVGLMAGDIREYHSEQVFDAVLLHGPMYHIVDRDERIAVLKKCARLAGANGIVLAFAINRYAGYFYGVRSGAIMEPAYRQAVMEEMQSGIRRSEPGWFFHLPEELAAECEAAGLRVVATKSVATQAWMLPDVEARINDSGFLQDVIGLARDTEDHLAIGQDILAVAQAR